MSAAAFREMTTARGLEGTVVYDGPKYGLEKQEALRRADLLVHPTHDDAFALVVLEAMGAGLPVISTLEGGIPDEVEDGGTGLLYPKGNVTALAVSMMRLLGDPALRERMGQAGRDRYESRFTGACFEKRLLDILCSYV